MFKLDDLILPPAPAKAPAIDPTTLVARPNFAPAEWQSADPRTFGGEQCWTSKPAIESSADLRRVLALPRRPQPLEGTPTADALLELINRRFALPPGPCRCKELGRECITRLRLTQAWALYEIGLHGGLLGPIGVGHGKTILDLLAPLALRDCKTVVLLVPPGLVTQLIAEYELVGQHFRMPSMVVHGRAEGSVTVPGAPVLHVFPYSRLSRPEATVFLETLAPDAIIADEVHKLRHADTATTSRVLRYFANHSETRFCGWSGSITDSSIEDYAHLSALALRYKSPLPLDPMVVEDWARAIDPSDYPAPAGALLDLCEPGQSLIEGYHRRLVETPGVVATTEPAVDCELSIDERKAPALPHEVKEALTTLRASWVRPDGEELVEVLEMLRCAHQLSCGFYYRWIFPRGEPVSVIEEWLAARKAWRRELREQLKTRAEHLDSPKLCATAAARGWRDEFSSKRVGDLWYRDDGLPCWKAGTWERWKAARGTVEHETECVRIDDFLAQDAAAWGRDNRGVIWYQHKAFGEWVAEISGLPLHGGGPQAGPLIARERGDRSIVASIKSHGTGRDGLQRLFHTQLVANPPSSATDWEQLLGRLHRIGQNARTVHALFYRHTPELREHVDQALKRALYVQGTLGSAQKLRKGWALPEE